MKAISLLLILCISMSCSVLPATPAGDSTIAITDRQIIESDGSYNGFPSIAKAADGDWILSYRKGSAHVNTPLVILRRSRDSGKTWSPEVAYFDTSQPDPGLALMPDGRLMITFGKLDPDGISGAAYSLSNDDGLTWGAFTFFSTPVSETAAFSPGVLTVNGTVYSVAYGSQSDGSSNANLWTSVDNGSTWSLLSEIRQTNDVGINETGIAQVGATSLLAISRDDLNLNTWGHFSNDFGLTWSSQVDYTAQVGVLQDPQLVQTRTALLLFGRQYDTTKSPNEMVAFASYDGGLTFADRTVLDTYTGLPIDGGYCWPLLRSDGKIFLVYYADSNNLREPDIKSLVLQWDRKSAN